VGITSVGPVVRLEEAVVPDEDDELPEVEVADCELVQPAIATAPQMRQITTMNVLALIPVHGRLLYLFVAIFLHSWRGHNQRHPHQNQKKWYGNLRFGASWEARRVSRIFYIFYYQPAGASFRSGSTQQYMRRVMLFRSY
jgi:hypothetical protein